MRDQVEIHWWTEPEDRSTVLGSFQHPDTLLWEELDPEDEPRFAIAIKGSAARILLSLIENPAEDVSLRLNNQNHDLPGSLYCVTFQWYRDSGLVMSLCDNTGYGYEPRWDDVKVDPGLFSLLMASCAEEAFASN